MNSVISVESVIHKVSKKNVFIFLSSIVTEGTSTLSFFKNN